MPETGFCGAEGGAAASGLQACRLRDIRDSAARHKNSALSASARAYAACQRIRAVRAGKHAAAMQADDAYAAARGRAGSDPGNLRLGAEADLAFSEHCAAAIALHACDDQLGILGCLGTAAGELAMAAVRASQAARASDTRAGAARAESVARSADALAGRTAGLAEDLAAGILYSDRAGTDAGNSTSEGQ